MKFVLVGPTYPFRGGIAHYTTLLYENLRRRHDVELYSFTRQYPPFIFPGRTDRDPSELFWEIDAEPLIDPINPISWLQTWRRVRNSEPDILIMQWWVPYWAPAFASLAFLVRKFTQTRILFICHNVVPHESGLADTLSSRVTLRQGHHFIVHSKGDLAQLKAILPDADASRTALPVYDFFARGKPNEDEARRELNPSGKKVLLFFGFVRPYKGVDYLIRAMPHVLAQIEAHLLIVGEFWTPESRYRALIEDLGLTDSVTIVNRYVPNEEVPTYFAGADLVVLPYLEATQSAVIPIAYGFEKPVVTTTVGGLTEAVSDGETGLLVPPGDSEALAEAIIRYFREDLKAHLSANIRDQRERFSWDRLVDLIEELAAANQTPSEG
jgi:glycosyltransferase involved in cell wall biosynthesis